MGAADAEPMPAESQSRKEIDWERLDKKKFFVVGAGLFSGVTLCLFPLTVIKTRIQASPLSANSELSALQVTRNTFKSVLREEGVRGLYRGLGTVIVGTLPTRMVYLTTLEVMKLNLNKAARAGGLSEAAAAGGSNLLAGGIASLSSQLLVVPIDVVSQRQMMVREKGVSGAMIARDIVKAEGIRGLYRGFGASLAVYVPSSAMWWGAYGAYQKILWGLMPSGGGGMGRTDTATGWEIAAVQTGSGVLAGCTSAVMTTPLDTIKTRLQVAVADSQGRKPTFWETLASVIREEGVAGLMRGVVPRMANVALWGTCMVSTYEFLKRLAQRDMEGGGEEGEE